MSKPKSDDHVPDAPPPPPFTLADIEKIQKRALDSKWPYPYLFNALKALGVERYEVDVATCETRFVGSGITVRKGAPEGWTPLAVARDYSLDGVKAALRRSQAGEITYPEFLGEIAAAGVGFYRVDMRPRTVTYHGPKPYKLVEPVPDTKTTG